MNSVGKTIGVLSGKGGVGKTTLVVNLGVALQEIGEKVCIIEGNVTSSNLGLHLGIADFPLTIHDALKNKVKLFDAVLVHPSKVSYIPGSLSIADIRGATLSGFKKKIREIKAKYDFIIIDGSPGLDDNTIEIMKSCEEIIIVTNPEITAVADAIKIIEYARKEKVDIRGLVVNRFRGKDYELSIDEIETTADVPVVAIIPEDSNIPKSISVGYPAVLDAPDTEASIAFKKLAASMIGGVFKKERGTLEKIKDMFS